MPNLFPFRLDTLHDWRGFLEIVGILVLFCRSDKFQLLFQIGILLLLLLLVEVVLVFVEIASAGFKSIPDLLILRAGNLADLEKQISKILDLLNGLLPGLMRRFYLRCCLFYAVDDLLLLQIVGLIGFLHFLLRSHTFVVYDLSGSAELLPDLVSVLLSYRTQFFLPNLV